MRGEFEHRVDLLAVHAREPLQEIIHRGTILQILEKSLHRHAGPAEDESPAHRVRRGVHFRAIGPIEHVDTLVRAHVTCNLRPPPLLWSRIFSRIRWSQRRPVCLGAISGFACGSQSLGCQSAKNNPVIIRVYPLLFACGLAASAVSASLRLWPAFCPAVANAFSKPATCYRPVVTTGRLAGIRQPCPATIPQKPSRPRSHLRRRCARCVEAPIAGRQWPAWRV
jgi:hypothetical protein